MIARRTKPRRGPADIPADQWRNPDYLAFLRNECRCVASVAHLKQLGWEPTHFPTGMCEAAHGPVNGMSSKGPDCEAIPLSAEKHREMHQLGWPAFEAKYGFDRAKEAAAHWALFLIWREDLAK